MPAVLKFNSSSPDMQLPAPSSPTRILPAIRNNSRSENHPVETTGKGYGVDKQRSCVAPFQLYSRFWRDRRIFDTIANVVVYKLAAERLKLLSTPLSHYDNVLRVWSCGSSTGEEALSMSLMWQYHYIDHESVAERHGLKMSILGTDRSVDAVKQARNGHYSSHSMHDLPQPLAQKYFNEVDKSEMNLIEDARIRAADENKSSLQQNLVQTYYPPATEPMICMRSQRKQLERLKSERKEKFSQISVRVRERCRFQVQDFSASLPESEGPFDLILARYSVLLYSDQSAAVLTRIVKRCLAPWGFLVVGMTDSINPQLAECLCLEPLNDIDCQGIYQYRPIVDAKTETGDERPELSEFHRYNSLKDYLRQGLGEKAPVGFRNCYVSNKSKEILAAYPFERDPLYIPGDVKARKKNLENQPDNEWDGSVRVETDDIKPASMNANVAQKPLPQKARRLITARALDKLVSRLSEDAQRIARKRERRSRQLWKEEKRLHRLAKKHEKRRRARLLRRCRAHSRKSPRKRPSSANPRSRRSTFITEKFRTKLVPSERMTLKLKRRPRSAPPRRKRVANEHSLGANRGTRH